MSPGAPVRVLVADDDPLVRTALRRLISADPALEIVGEAQDAEEAVTLVRERRPDVAVLDVKMPGGGGVRAAREIRALSPLTSVVALSAYTDRNTAFQMIRAGATGYVVKGAPGRELLDTIRRCAAGESRLSPEVTTDLVAELSEHLEETSRRAESARLLADRIRTLIDGRELRLVFQPVVDLETGAAVALEALSRFPPDLPGPYEWFGSAEAVGLRAELERHAAAEALRHLPEIPAGVDLAINLSPSTLGLRPWAAAPGHERGRLVLEITEHAPVEDYGALERELEQARAQGIRVAVDDAGAGFANLRHILRLAPDLIKLDAELTRGLHADRRRRALARALVTFADELGATIVAEGIETAEELAALRELGVRHGQGYFLARPQPLEALRPLLSR